uniref:7TM_GPCR_Srx domain-containing protein n=1 Tax=Parastrongyloides trichosuri TaxID=131310 RepID=A0A0N4ZQ83_PARTI
MDVPGSITTTEKFTKFSYVKYNVIIGISYVIICLTLMILQLLTFLIFYTNKHLYKNMAFKIIFHHGIISFLSMIPHFASSFYIIIFTNNDNFFGRFIAALLQSGYIASVTFVTLLTLNRFDVLYHKIFFPKINRSKFYNISIILIYIYFTILLILYNFPGFEIIFSLQHFGWTYVKQRGGGQPIGYLIESNTVIVMLAISFVLYLSMVGKIIMLRKKSSSMKIFKWEDWKLLLQAIFNYLFVLLLEIAWGSWEIIFFGNVDLNMILNYLFIFVIGSNAIFGIIIIQYVFFYFLYIYYF